MDSTTDMSEIEENNGTGIDDVPSLALRAILHLTGLNDTRSWLVCKSWSKVFEEPKLLIKLLLESFTPGEYPGRDVTIAARVLGMLVSSEPPKRASKLVECFLRTFGEQSSPNLGCPRSGQAFSGDSMKEVLEYSISYRVFLNQRDFPFPHHEYHTAVERASYLGNLEVVKLLVEAGATLDPPPYPSEEEEDEDESEEDRGRRLDWTSRLVETPLTIASDRGHLEVVLYLIGKGANKEHKCSFGMTALTRAASAGHLKIVQCLVEAGAIFEENDESKSGSSSAMMYAAENGHLEVVKYLVSAGSDMDINTVEGTPLLVAASNGHLEVVKFLQTAGASLEGVRLTGETALIIASDYGHLETVKFLVEAGAMVTARCNQGHTAMMKAMMLESEDVLQYLKSL